MSSGRQRNTGITFSEFNGNLLRPADAKAVMGIENRRTLEKLYPYIPRLIFQAQTQQYSRFPLYYMRELATKYSMADNRQGTIAVVDFRTTRTADRLLNEAIEDVEARIDQANTPDGIRAYDVGFIFNIGHMTVSEWCQEKTGAVKPIRNGGKVIVPETDIRSVFEWYDPNIQLT